ncbi:MAG: hypothetical protein IJS41_03250, partial [Clostridia bacterium]|nr:hypothetical protein [Clostridia bacterium]
MNLLEKLGELLTGGNKEQQQNQGAEAAPSLQSGVQSAVDAWLGFLDQAAPEVGSLAKGAAQAAGSLAQSVGQAVTGIFNSARDTTKENIQSGNYSVAAEPKTLENHFSDHSDLAAVAEDAKRTLAGEERTSHIQQSPKKEEGNPWDSNTPFESKELNNMYLTTALGFDELNPDAKSDDKFRDAWEITNQYIQDMTQARQLNPNATDEEIRAIAEKNRAGEEQRRSGKYAGSGKGYAELEQLLGENGFITERQHEENIQQGIINAARKMQSGDSPFDQLIQLTRGAPTQENMLAVGQALAALGDEGQQLMAYVQNMTDEDAMRFIGSYAAQNYRPVEMTFDEADKYLNESNPMYTVAKSAQGKTEDFQSAYGNLIDVGKKLGKNIANLTTAELVELGMAIPTAADKIALGMRNLTDAEQQAVMDAMNAPGMEWMQDWLLGMDKNGLSTLKSLTPEQKKQLAEFSGKRQGQLQEASGLFSAYEMTPFAQGLFEEYVKTPEGAAKWAEDAKGTKDEQKARDNLWFVERESKYSEAAGKPDFAKTGKAREDFHSGDAGFDQKYNVINNIDGAADKAGLLADIGGSSSYSVALYNFMTDEEKGIFNSYAHAGAIQEANEYLDYLSYAINERMTQSGAERMQAMGRDGLGGGLVASAVSVPLSLTRGIGYLDQLGQKVGQFFTGRPVEQNSQANMIGRLADSARQGVQEQADWNVNILGQNLDAFDFLYGTLMSGIDSFAAGQIGAALGGIANTAEKAEKLASWTGAAILGGGAAQSAMQETYDRGGNDGQALLMGAIAGANETFWEHFSIGNLVEHGHSVGKKTFGKELKNVLTEAGVNFSEELNTSLANGLAEYILNHDDRDAAQKAREYERLGLTPEEAKAKAQEEFWVSAVMDGVGGALMGGAFGAIENAQSARYTKQVDTAAGRGLSSEAKSSILAMAAADAGSSAAKLAKKYSGKAMTDRQAGEVFRALSTEGAEKIRESLNLDFARQIMSKGGGMDAQAADAITAMLRGENLTGEQVAALAASPEGMEIVDEIFASPQGEANTSSTADAGPDEGDSSGSASRQNDSGGEELEPVEFLPMPEEEGVTSSAADASTYPHPQSARLPNGRSLVSADLSPDETSATGGRQGFVPSEGKALGDGSLSMTPGKETARQERISITLKADEGKAEHRAERFSEEDGTVRVTLEDGRKVDLEETDLDAGQRTVALAAAGMEDQDAAAEMMRMYEPAAGKETAREAEARQLEEEDTSSVTLRVPPSPARGRLLETSQAEEERQARDYAMGFQAEYEAARDGRSVEESKSIYAEMLTGKQREAARIMGERAFAQAEAEARERNAQAAREAGYRTVEEAAGERADDIRPYSAGFGVLFERVNEGMEKGGERVKAMLKLLDAVGKEYGLQFRMHDSLEHGANGKYEAGTNIVHLALDAEAGAITKAASHEGFHFIKQFSPEMAKQITDFVVKKLNSAAGYDLGARVQEVMRQYRDHAGQQLTEEAAIEEIVADSMLDVIGTEENMKSLFRERRSAAEKIAAWISDTYNRFKEILNRLAKTSPEVNALKDDVDYIGRIRDMYRQAMEKAAEAWRQAQAGYSEALSQDEAVQEYRQEMKAATAREDAESSLNSLLKTQFMMHFQGWLKANPGKTEEGLKKYRQALLNYKQKKIALSVALQRQGLDQISKQGVRAASYAADQVMNMNESSEKLSLPASGRTKKDFDYETLVTKPNMTMTQLNELTGTEIEEIVKKGTSDFAHSVLVDIEERHGGSTYVYNKDTNTNIKFNRNSFTHSIHNRAKLADYVTVTQKIDSILENAVAVNETDGDKKIQSNYGTIYIGAATGNNAVHIVRMLVNNKTKGVENYDVLYSIYKTEPKKEDVRTTTRGVGQSHVSGASAAPSEITISDLLKLVKESGELYSIVSKDVSEKMGKTRPYNHKFTDRLRYSLPARSQAQEERAAAETVKQDAELYARMRQDEDARAALLLMNRLHEQTTQGGENALIQAGAFEKRL